MRKFFGVIFAEVVKQHKNMHNSKFMYFTLILWPLLIFIDAYYSYKPFDFSKLPLQYNLTSSSSLITFLATGYISYNLFWSMVQSAWQMSDERKNGTLETVFLSPANRLAIMYGRSLGCIFDNIWMFFIFSIFLLIINPMSIIETLKILPIIFLILILSAMIWGAFLNSIFLFSRDASFLFNIFDDPMCLFSGVRIPTECFPIFGKIIAVIFPLTHTLITVRDLINFTEPSIFWANVLKLAVCLIIISIITIIIINLAESNSRKKGTFNFY